MRIGIDIDDTITKTSEYVKIIKKRLFPDRDPEEKIPSSLYKKIMVSMDEEIHQNVALKEDAVEVLQELRKRGHTLYFITMRGNISHDADKNTYDYFEKNNIPYDQIYFKCYHKGKVASACQLDLFIDDNETMCEEVYDQGIPVIKIKTNEKSCFREFEKWKDILEYIIEMEKLNGKDNNE